MDLIWLCVILGAAVFGLLAWVLSLSYRLRRLRRALDARDAHPGCRLSVVVRNPRQLARQRSPLGARVAAIAPGFVTRRVYDVLARELADELSARGVEAEIEVQGH